MMMIHKPVSKCKRTLWSLVFCRVLTGSIGRATSTPSSLLRWSWDPAASEILKAGGSEHNFQEQLSERGMRPRERKGLYQSINTTSPTVKLSLGIWWASSPTTDHRGTGTGPSAVTSFAPKTTVCNQFLLCCLIEQSLPVTATPWFFFFYFSWVVLGMGEG